MGYSHHERLSALDASFLRLEDENSHMHVGSVALFDAAPLTREDGGLDIETIRRMIENTLRRMPRYRQRLAWVPLLGHPVWVDDARFNLHYHLRHIALPAPGNDRQLKRTAGQVLAQALDRSKPLWELWIVEGVAGNRFAIVTKAHHCMVDGIAAAELVGSAMAVGPDAAIPRARRGLPRPAPGPFDLLLAEIGYHARGGIAAARAIRRALRHPRGALTSAWDGALGLRDVIRAGVHRASPTPINVALGPHRRFDWVRFELADVKEVKSQLGGTVNDVVLAVATGALRRFLRGRGVRVEDLDFRAMIPVNVRTEDDPRDVGNRIVMVVARLPIDEAEPRTRLERVIDTTRELKASRQARGLALIEELSDWTVASLFVQFAQLVARFGPFNVVVTNVPGPQRRAYLLGSPLLEVYPLVPLYRNQDVGIALFSYDGGLYWGLNADWDSVPDLHDLVGALVREFEALRKASAEPRA
ncbi:MAG: wax ester/triacylglycerol synthase family O-acyltransferase [Deltaproteobacteria bacterium]|nr:MAG: wax ester/triacylglycerol synthase family O-acyltransferase [Deltaproteobacteria bacterium]